MIRLIRPHFQRLATPRTAEGVWLPPSGVEFCLRHGPKFSERLPRMRGVATSQGVLLVTERDNLPWAPDACYVGRYGQSQLWLPVNLEVNVAATWVQKALQKHTRTAAAVLCLPEPKLVVSLGALGPVGLSELESWLRAGQRA